MTSPPPPRRETGRSGASARPLPKGVSPSSGAWRDPPPLTGGTQLGEFIPSLMRQIQKTQAPWRDEMEARWAVLVGAKYASHARPGDYNAASRTLVVTVDHPILAFEASRELRNLPERIREAVPSAPIQRAQFRYQPNEEEKNLPPRR